MSPRWMPARAAAPSASTPVTSRPPCNWRFTRATSSFSTGARRTPSLPQTRSPPTGRPPPRPQRVADDAGHLRLRDGEADALRPGADGHVNADQLAVDVQQRPAGVARVDAGVRLDQLLVRHVLVETDVALDGADDADAD